MSDNGSSGSSGSSSSAVGQDRGALSDAWRTLLRSVGLGRNGTSAVRASLEELIEENEDDSPIDPHEGAIIRNVLGLRDITAYDVMVPRADIVAVEQSLMLSEAAKVMGDAAHSRMPIYRGTLDDVIGMIHLKDVVRHLNRGEDVPVSELAREVTFVAPSSRALDLLQEMRMTRRHLALVVDEYGGIDGLITIEDLVEEIVGEIEDESDIDQSLIQERPDGALLCLGSAEVADVFRRLGLDGVETDSKTLSGFLAERLDNVPSAGAHVDVGDFRFEVLKANNRRAERIRAARIPPPDEAPQSGGSQ